MVCECDAFCLHAVVVAVVWGLGLDLVLGFFAIQVKSYFCVEERKKLNKI